MKKMINKEIIEGYVYQSNLTIKQVQNSESQYYQKDFISGNIEVAVDEDGINVIPVHFTFVTPVTSTGAENRTYSTLQKIIDGPNWINDGKEAALKVRINTALSLNDFYNQNDELVSTKINEGGFVTIINELSDGDKNKFESDMVITSVKRIEADPERNIDKDYVVVKGAVFNFRNELLPVDFAVRNEKGMEYFEGLDASATNPVFTKVWGKINCLVQKTEVVEESAFGEAAVSIREKKSKEWTITGTAAATYDFGDEDVLSADQLKKAMQDRDLKLAETKKRSDEYKASKGTVSTSSSTTATSTAGFIF